jgi:uncharacterized protein (DUF2336 family)
MTEFLRKLLGFNKIPLPVTPRANRDALRYAQERQVAEHGDVGTRIVLARSAQTHLEVLYYLAEHDPDPAVRRAVAANPCAPYQASPILSRDKDGDVRYALAERLVRLLPDLTRDRHAQLYSFAVQVLGTLALDEVLKVRLALSTALKDRADAPPMIVGVLARDAERAVSEPILRFCTALADDDLLDILKKYPASWVVQAVGHRPTVSAPVAGAVIKTGDETAGAVLLANKGAIITPALLNDIVEQSRDFPSWQRGAATHIALTPKMARALATFIEPSLHDFLIARADFTPELRDEIISVVGRRVEFAATEHDDARSRVLAAQKNGHLTEDVMMDALAMRDNDFVIEALAVLVGTDCSTIKHLLIMKTPKPIIAVCWKAGFSMRLALAVQRDVARLDSQDMIYARGGTNYPLTEQEMTWQLNFHGLI